MDFESMIEGFRGEIIRAAKDLIQIKSVKGKPEPGMPCGRGPYEALKYVLDLSQRMGFAAKNIDGYAGHAEFGDGEELVGVLVHVDVVPEGDGWTFSPYSGEIYDDKLYGRGSLDDKGPTIAVLYALKVLKDSGIAFKKKIRIVFGTDEESGFDGIQYYLSKEKTFDMGFTPDARFPLISGEKGILLYKLRKNLTQKAGAPIKIISISGGSSPNMVPSFCKAVISIENEMKSELTDLMFQFKQSYGFDITFENKDDLFVLSSTGRTAHGSSPEEGLNAISIMMLFLGLLKTDEDELSELIKIYNEKIGFRHYGESFHTNFIDKVSGKMSLNAGLIELNENGCEMMLDIRYPISFKAEEIAETIQNEFTGYDIEQLFALNPIYFPENHKLLQKLMKVYKDNIKDPESKPIITGGATYARSMENVIAFGPVFSDEPDIAHKSDEYIKLDDLIKITKIYAQALYELARSILLLCYINLTI